VLISKGIVSERDVYEAQRALVAAGPGTLQPQPPVAPDAFPVAPEVAPAAAHAPVTPTAPPAPEGAPSGPLHTAPASPPPPPFTPQVGSVGPESTADETDEPLHAVQIADPIEATAMAAAELLDAPVETEGNAFGATGNGYGAVAEVNGSTSAPSLAPAPPAPTVGGTFDAADLPMVEAEVEADQPVTVEEELKEPNLADFLMAVVDGTGSDLHLTAGLPPTIRVHGELRPLKGYRKLLPKDLQELVYSMLTQKQRETFEENLELDVSYSLPGKARFRVNIFQQRDALGSVMRLIPFEIKSLDELGVPSAIKEFASLRRGLVLVTGITGSGKSTTLAGLIDMINCERAEHIMTVEDPIEFLHQHKKAIVNQREVGEDTHSFAKALKHVLRQDPDIILVGEMRDLETISTALTAAETGHLVFGTLHTQDAPQSIDRVIDVFPPHQQEQIRVMLAGTLAGVVSQQLLPTANGKGRALAAEVLVVTPAVQNLIREGKVHQIYTSMQAGGKFGMQVMDQHLAQLVKKGTVTYEMALERCHHVSEFNRLAGRG
jgi:twitching motility protein PilT